MKEIYLDGAANTPLDKTVFKQMKPYLTDKFVGNSFAIHDFGIRASQAIEHARMQVAEAVKATPEEVFFTSGATEGNNWIIRSVADEQLANGMSRPKIVCGATEHSSVLTTCFALSDFGSPGYCRPDFIGHCPVFCRQGFRRFCQRYSSCTFSSHR